MQNVSMKTVAKLNIITIMPDNKNVRIIYFHIDQLKMSQFLWETLLANCHTLFI